MLYWCHSLDMIRSTDDEHWALIRASVAGSGLAIVSLGGLLTAERWPPLLEAVWTFLVLPPALITTPHPRLALGLPALVVVYDTLVLFLALRVAAVRTWVKIPLRCGGLAALMAWHSWLYALGATEMTGILESFRRALHPFLPAP